MVSNHQPPIRVRQRPEARKHYRARRTAVGDRRGWKAICLDWALPDWGRGTRCPLGVGLARAGAVTRVRP